MEAQIVPPTGLPYYLVTSKKLRKTMSLSSAGVLVSLLKGYREASAYLKNFNPDVVISTGGYTAAGTALASARQKRPTIIQEYNAIPGRTNLWLSRWATRICIWFGETAKSLPRDKSIITGVPLRPGIVSNQDRGAARIELGLDSGLFTILILGGSQGSKRLNELTLEMARRLDTPAQIVHQIGERNVKGAIENAAEHNAKTAKYHARAFLASDEMPLAYAATDLLICRCGISTLAEGCANGVPMIMVPLPTAYADHQTANAEILEKHGAGIHAPEGSLTGTLLAKQVTQLMNDRTQLRNMSDMARQIGKPNAAREVARLAVSLASGNP
jgi:UDP-N-acetylglucosamine--N-acetylmuramyl-(pentapeptide) pyrophosphoryl-undecaprenol N-acetylglucosamine transferase